MFAPPRPFRATLALLLFASSLTIAAGAVVAPTLPAMRDHFGATSATEQSLVLLLTVPGLAIALTAPFAGWAADRVGRRAVLFVGLMLYGLAGAAPALLDHLGAILVARAALGVAIACTMTAATAAIFDLWEGAARERAIGLQGMATGLAGVVYPLLGGALASVAWTWPYAALGLALLAALAVPATVPPSTPVERARVAPQSAASLIPAVAPVLVLGATGMMLLYVIPIRGPFQLVDLGYPSPMAIALLTTVPSAVAMLVGLQFGTLRTRLTPWATTALAYAALAAGFGLMAAARDLPLLLVGLALCGFGFGLNAPNLTSWLQTRVPVTRRGQAAGLYTTAVFLGQFGATFTVGGAGRDLSFEQVATGAASVAGLIACLAAWWASRHHMRVTPPVSASPPPVASITAPSRTLTRPPG
jgi:MFS family permease